MQSGYVREFTGESAEQSACVRVVEEVATTLGIDPIDIQEPLDDTIDTDALDALFSNRNPEERLDRAYISFVYYGCRVTLDSDGSVDVTQLQC